jgi:hypothetical protein
MEWRFKKLTPNDTLQNASHLEFFHNEALQSTVDALAREDIQNRLDARSKNEPRVEVRYRFCGPTKAVGRAIWFKELSPHLASPQVKEELGAEPSIDRPLNWLVIEDFSTSGLEGDAMQFQDATSGAVQQRNDFFWFIRNVGRSGKKGGDRGRWGLGKIVYPAASQVRSIFAYTVRRSDKKRFLIGRAVLAVHQLPGSQHDSEGYFGRFKDEQHSFFATPIEESDVLDRFASDFRVTRQANEPGLSVVIPWPEEDIKFDALVRSLIEHWFWVILEDRLVVRLTIDLTGEEVLLDKDSLESIVQSRIGEHTLAGTQLMRKIRFAREVQAFDLKSPSFHCLVECPSGSAPKWDSAQERFSGPENLDAACQSYHAGELIGFDIPVRVRRNDGCQNELSSFELYIQRSTGGEQAVETFLRDGLTISGQRSLREPGVLAIIKAENNVLGTLLGDAENPAHTRWEQGGKHFRGRYDHGPSILSYVKKAATCICSLLSRKPDGIDKDLLNELFHVVEPGESDAIAPKKKKGKVVPPVPPEVKGRNYFVECNKTTGGFHFYPHPQATKSPAAIQLRAAYEVIRGNPFKLHHPADFDFSKKSSLNLSVEGLTTLSAEPGRIMFRVDRPDFSFKAQGFDPHRDLIVDVRPLHDSDDGEKVEEDEQEDGSES